MLAALNTIRISWGPGYVPVRGLAEDVHKDLAEDIHKDVVEDVHKDVDEALMM